MIWNRLWLVLVIYLVAIAALFAGLTALGVSSPAQFVVSLLIAVLIGCEGRLLAALEPAPPLDAGPVWLRRARS